jgi:class 3 adenylate cyclase
MMTYLKFLQDAIRKMHGAESRHLGSIPVVEKFQGRTVWDGVVEVFALAEHPTAQRCYAWAYEEEASGKQQAVTVLEVPPVVSPRTAVRAAIVNQLRPE